MAKFKINTKIGKSKGGGGLKKPGAKLGGLGKGLGSFSKPTVSGTKFGGAGKFAKPAAPARPAPFKPKKANLKSYARGR